MKPGQAALSAVCYGVLRFHLSHVKICNVQVANAEADAEVSRLGTHSHVRDTDSEPGPALGSEEVQALQAQNAALAEQVARLQQQAEAHRRMHATSGALVQPVWSMSAATHSDARRVVRWPQLFGR
jgi:hypothetical protein